MPPVAHNTETSSDEELFEWRLRYLEQDRLQQGEVNRRAVEAHASHAERLTKIESTISHVQTDMTKVVTGMSGLGKWAAGILGSVLVALILLVIDLLTKQ